jgi:prepilin-type N-terminal cleavage/methylation domain-containing protein
MGASPAINQTSRSGVTLIELLVAISVLSLLMLLYFGLFNQASRAWSAGGDNAERRRNDRALADFIGNELRGALLPVETLSNTGHGDLQFVINPPNTQVPDTLRNGDTIFWQAPLATEATYGDVAEIGYFVRWNTATNGDPQPSLCRFFVNPSTTDTSGAVTQNSNYLIYDPDPKKWLSSTVIDAVAPATKDTGYLGMLGENVIGLWIRSYGLDGQELPRTFDSRTGYTCTFKTTSQTWTEQRYLPAKVRISIAQLDSHYAPKLRAATTALRPLISDTGTRDADQFLTALEAAAAGNSALAALLPGVHIYSNEIQLANGR